MIATSAMLTPKEDPLEGFFVWGRIHDPLKHSEYPDHAIDTTVASRAANEQGWRGKHGFDVHPEGAAAHGRKRAYSVRSVGSERRWKFDELLEGEEL